MSAKSQYIPTRKAVVRMDCPQVLARIRRKRKAKAKRAKKSRAVNFKRRK